MVDLLKSIRGDRYLQQRNSFFACYDMQTKQDSHEVWGGGQSLGNKVSPCVLPAPVHLL